MPRIRDSASITSTHFSSKKRELAPRAMSCRILPQTRTVGHNAAAIAYVINPRHPSSPNYTWQMFLPPLQHQPQRQLSVPVFSLSTVNEDGTTNMNIVTYASPVGIEPERLWMVSLYKVKLDATIFLVLTRKIQYELSWHWISRPSRTIDAYVYRRGRIHTGNMPFCLVCDNKGSDSSHGRYV